MKTVGIEQESERVIKSFNDAIHFITWDIRHHKLTPEAGQQALKEAIDRQIDQLQTYKLHSESDEKLIMIEDLRLALWGKEGEENGRT